MGCRRDIPSRLKGVTLIELMIVIVILGILATLVVPRFLDRPEEARRTKAKVEIRNLESALGLFKADTGRFPSTSEGLDALVNDPGIAGWKADGYLQHGKVPDDPWRNPYLYLSPGLEGRDYDLISYGRDGETGGSGPDRDIESWNLDAE